MTKEQERRAAITKDRADPLARFKNEFHCPVKKGKPVIYFCGNSLGLQPKLAADYLDKEMKKWREFAVEGHFEGEDPWMYYYKLSKDPLSVLVGAKTHEVVCMNNLTTNLHLMLGSFYRPQGERKKLLIEKGAFPSDHFAATTFMKLMGVDPKVDLVELVIPEDGYVDIQTITKQIKAIGEELALALLPGIQYYTGQFFNLKAISEACHEVGAYAGFDLAHAIGNLPLSLHDDGADFAVWCSYKYLNSGPGNVSGVFVHEKHSMDTSFPRLGGWWGQDETTRFKMENVFQPMTGADGWQLSNMNIISTAIHHASLSIFEQAGIKNLRAKSVELTGFLEHLLRQSEIISRQVTLLTPPNKEERGCQISIFLQHHGKEIFDHLIDHGVILDWREPNVIRAAPVPLYNSFQEVYEFVEILEDAFEKYA